ncbi:MAG: hypothetical protein AAFN41_09845 [Planctomycetota bacterium]
MDSKRETPTHVEIPKVSTWKRDDPWEPISLSPDDFFLNGFEKVIGFVQPHHKLGEEGLVYDILSYIDMAWDLQQMASLGDEARRHAVHALCHASIAAFDCTVATHQEYQYCPCLWHEHFRRPLPVHMLLWESIWYSEYGDLYEGYRGLMDVKYNYWVLLPAFVLGRKLDPIDEVFRRVSDVRLIAPDELDLGDPTDGIDIDKRARSLDSAKKLAKEYEARQRKHRDEE